MLFSFTILFAVLFLSLVAKILNYYEEISLEYYDLGYATTLESFGLMACYENMSYVEYSALLDGFSFDNGTIYYGGSYIILGK
ncbi:MAG: hypothetical protein ACP5RK_00545 [Candidatus Micrarchaeia archaeon]